MDNQGSISQTEDTRIRYKKMQDTRRSSEGGGSEALGHLRKSLPGGGDRI